MQVEEYLFVRGHDLGEVFRRVMMGDEQQATIFRRNSQVTVAPATLSRLAVPVTIGVTLRHHEKVMDV